MTVWRNAGLGDLLLSACAAWRFARDTHRTLVIDWRGTWYTGSRRINLFDRLFHRVDEWGGVPVRVSTADDPFESPPAAQRSDVGEAANAQAACRLIDSGVDVDDPHVQWWGCIAPAHPRPAQTAALLRDLQPLPHLADAVAHARQTLLGDGPSIGVHLRHGNGGDILSHARHWADGLAVHRVTSAIRTARAALGADTPVLVCTDSVEVHDALRTMVPGVRAVPKPFRPAGEGEQHRWADASTMLDVTFVEMFLLAHTTALVRMPPASYFSTPAAYLKQPAPTELLVREPSGLDPAIW